MQVNYSDEEPILTGKSIFLAGPTPRKASVQSWRPGAVKIIDELGFGGIVYVPERKIPDSNYDYLKQVEWEYTCLEQASMIVFWVPRSLTDMPGFVTNTEIGFWLAKTPNKVLYGRPDWAEKCGYQDWLYNKITGKKPINDLKSILQITILNLCNSLNGLATINP
jgi:hypothetical protein